MSLCTEAVSLIDRIRQSNLTIYNAVPSELFVSDNLLEHILNETIVGTNIDLPLRTRSKFVKSMVCRALGYPVPDSFQKTQPRFLGQLFDTYIQKSNNLQVWNEEISPARRYVIIRVNDDNVICQIKVIKGNVLAAMDTTGTLTYKFQARVAVGDECELATPLDTTNLLPFVTQDVDLAHQTPTDFPQSGKLLSINSLYMRLAPLVGEEFADGGYDQERNRGGMLQLLVSRNLGYCTYRENGQFPDVPQQLLEVKLQTAPTIDLGVICPNSVSPLAITVPGLPTLRHCDVRYAIFCANTNGMTVKITRFILTNGENFFSMFPQFQGMVKNAKLQIPLPGNFFT